ncbi:60S ribosomal export protein NMD3 [Salarchaeum japonicum]|uniref:60S ribosomal export protein NMD3 n=1 Tax=Salarchaeum japonicum TaxID=555573 RepID=A0AAV3SZM0_9EURY|nr:60S ribosomal export protein NMD3 [Salarchaeum japonicum]
MSTESATFCPRCGDPTTEAETGATRRERALCNDCYFDDFDLVDVPDTIEVRVCARCGAVHRGNRWVDVGAQDYTDIAIEETTEALGVHVGASEFDWQVRPEQVDATTIRMHCRFSGIVRGEPMTEEVTVPVRISKETCLRCGRIAGDYYASVVQVRAVGDRTPTTEETERAKEIANDIVADMEATGDRNAFVTELSEKPEGLDMKLSTTKIGKNVSRKLTEEFGGSFSDSETLVTEDEDGNEVYRVTFAVRLPEFVAGDVIDLEDDDGGPVLVRSVRGNLKGVRVTTGEPYEASYEVGDAPDARKLGTTEDAVDTTVVTVEDENAVQLLDPETYEAKTVARPDYMDESSDTVPVLRSREGIHVLPDA